MTYSTYGYTLLLPSVPALKQTVDTAPLRQHPRPWCAAPVGRTSKFSGVRRGACFVGANLFARSTAHRRMNSSLQLTTLLLVGSVLAEDSGGDSRLYAASVHALRGKGADDGA